MHVHPNYYRFFFFTFSALQNIKMNTKNINFANKKILKSDFYKKKVQFQIDNIDVKKILVSKKEPYGTKNVLKYFIRYNDNDAIRPVCLRLPQKTGYFKEFNENATMSFRVNNKQLLKHYNKVWERIEKLIKINFESKPVYVHDDKYIKTKIKIYADSIVTNFHNKKIPKEKSPCKCPSLVILDSIIKANKKYYPQTFPEESKYVQEKIKNENYIDDDLKSDSDSNEEIESDNE